MERSKGLTVLAEGRYARFAKREGWEFIDRDQITGVVMIMPITREGRLVLVEQYRPPLGRSLIEWPAGLAGDLPGSETEPLVEAARRELLEETGYRAEEMVFLTEGASSPGLTSETLAFFLARGLDKVGEGGGDHTEDIIVHEIEPNHLETWLTAQEDRGMLIDLKVYAGLYFLFRQGIISGVP